MTKRHIALWIDHNEAKYFHVDNSPPELRTIHSHAHQLSKPSSSDMSHFYAQVVSALKDAGKVLVVGPGQAKLEFAKYVQKHNHELEPNLVGLETVDHPTDGQLVAFARHYFLKFDQMQGTVPLPTT